jgi:hypothetical protein
MNRSGTSRDGGCKGELSTSARGLGAGLSGAQCGDANLFFHAETLFSVAGTLIGRAANLVSRIPDHDARNEALLRPFATLVLPERSLDFQKPILVSRKEAFLLRNQSLMCRAEGLVFRKPGHESRRQNLLRHAHGLGCETTGLERRATGFGRDAAHFIGGANASRRCRRAMLRPDATLHRSAMKPGPVVDTGRSHAKCPKPGFRSNVFK